MNRFTFFGAAALLLASNSAVAVSETSFTYGGIYKSLKTAQNTEFSQLSLNFFLRETGTDRVCPTTRVYLSDGEQSFDLSVTKGGKLLLPLDKKLKQDHAAVTLVTEQEVACHLAMEIAVAEFELEHVTVEKPAQWLAQFKSMYATLAGWPGKYFMPEITGLKFKLAKGSLPNVYTDDSSAIEFAPLGNNEFVLTAEQVSKFKANGQLKFGATVEKVTPILAK